MRMRARLSEPTAREGEVKAQLLSSSGKKLSYSPLGIIFNHLYNLVTLFQND